jgi:uncharacterized protein YigE (DUF2233 family)
MRLAPRFLAASLASFVLLFGARAAVAQRARREVEVSDLWSEPASGVRYLRRMTSLPCTVHALVVDLDADGVRVEATPYDERWRSVSDYAREHRLAAAVNGGFWGPFARAEGVTAGGGERWPDGEDDEEHGFFAIDARGRAWISPPEEVVTEIPEERLAHAVSGRPMLVRDGQADLVGLDLFEHANNRHPRTAVGVARDGRTVFLVVVDGRMETSRGLTLYELADLMVELGAHTALNLDGGGSSAMYVARSGGVVNAPSGGRWEARLGLGVTPERATKVRVARDGIEERYVRGREREVMNHVGVVAPMPESVEARGADVLGGVPAEDAGEMGAARPAFRLGRTREVLYPALVALVALSVLGVAFALVRRRIERRRSRA